MKCPICQSSNYEYNGRIWFYEKCKDCGFEHSGSSGIVRQGFIESILKHRTNRENK